MSDEARILFANDAFYAAFARADMLAMNTLWSQEHPVSVIHPGAAITRGRVDVLASWAAILEGVDSFDIEFRQPVVQMLDHSALVLCYESVGAHSLIATNVFVREGETWKLVHHQSGPSPLLPDAEGKEHRPVH